MNVDEKPYIDGFVAAVPGQNKDKFLEIARQAATIYREHGALQVVEMIYGGFQVLLDE